MRLSFGDAFMLGGTVIPALIAALIAYHCNGWEWAVLGYGVGAGLFGLASAGSVLQSGDFCD